MPLEPFGSYLYKKRFELRLRQKDVAIRGGLSQSYISDLEKSARGPNPITPTRQMVAKIALGLGVSIREVEEAAGYTPGSTSETIPVGERIVLKPGQVVQLDAVAGEENTILLTPKLLKLWRAIADAEKSENRS